MVLHALIGFRVVETGCRAVESGATHAPVKGLRIVAATEVEQGPEVGKGTAGRACLHSGGSPEQWASGLQPHSIASDDAGLRGQMPDEDHPSPSRTPFSPGGFGHRCRPTMADRAPSQSVGRVLP